MGEETMAKKSKSKRHAGRARTERVSLQIYVHHSDIATEAATMNWNPESHQTDEAQEHDEAAAATTEQEHGASGALQALDDLERLHTDNRDEFLRMAAVQELGPQVREALNALLALSPEAVQALGEVVRMSPEEQALIRRTLHLSDEIQAALRGLLNE
jgi:hypothetical protein